MEFYTLHTLIFGPDIIERNIAGLVAEQIPGIRHKSLSPLGGSWMWDGVLSHCPLFGFLRYAFNPMILGSGEVGSDISYVNSPSFFLCISLEHLNYHYLLPAGLFIESLNYICSRWWENISCRIWPDLVNLNFKNMSLDERRKFRNFKKFKNLRKLENITKSK